MMKICRYLPLLLLLTVYSCGNQSDAEFALEPSSLAEMSPNVAEQDNQLEVDESVDIERKIIKEGDISFETSDIRATINLIAACLKKYEAYISSDNVYDYKDKVEHRVTVRVPSENFELLLDEISSSVKKIDSKNINALDVTEEFIDIEARVKTKKELEDRYKSLLNKAHTVEDILKIEKEIGQLRVEIESIEGRLKYLKDKVSYSTLSIQFYEKESISFGFLSKVGNALKNGWSHLLWFLIGLVNLWAFVLVAIMIVVVVRRYRKKKRGKIT